MLISPVLRVEMMKMNMPTNMMQKMTPKMTQLTATMMRMVGVPECQLSELVSVIANLEPNKLGSSPIVNNCAPPKSIFSKNVDFLAEEMPPVPPFHVPRSVSSLFLSTQLSPKLVEQHKHKNLQRLQASCGQKQKQCSREVESII